MTYSAIASTIRRVSLVACGALLIGSASLAYAGGVALGATRLIYNSSDRQSSLAVINSDAQHPFLLQSWVEDVNGKRSGDFAITPPLFVIKPSSENTLRLIHVGASLPTDRETAYWISVKAIPAKDKDKTPDQSTLQLSFTSRIKLFYRPEGLRPAADDAPAMLAITREHGQLTVHNPTPYYQTLVNIQFDGRDVPSIMVPPQGQLALAGSSTVHRVLFQTINDYGAVTRAQQKVLP